MAERYANLPSSVWRDFQGIPDQCKLLLVYLASSPHSSILNADKHPLGYIAVDLQWEVEEIEKLLLYLEENRWIAWDPVTDEVAILYKPLRNSIAGPKQITAAERVAKSIQSKKIAEAVLDILRGTLSDTLLHTLSDTASIPYQYPPVPDPEPASDAEPETAFEPGNASGEAVGSTEEIISKPLDAETGDDIPDKGDGVVLHEETGELYCKKTGTFLF